MDQDTVRTFRTSIDIPQDVRSQMVALCNQQLADTFDLSSQVKQAHWNMKGQEFQFVHELMDDLHERLLGQADTVAERVAQLGGFVTGTARMACASTRMAEMPTTLTDALDYVAALVERYARLCASNRAAIDAATAVNDQATADIFIEFARELDKDLWFLESHLIG